MASSSSSSSLSDPSRRQYDVFLSFRGVDTRHTFTCYLHDFLRRKGIDAFFDEELRKGNDLVALLDRIEQSKISIVVFSENYANSSWCLEEIAKIIECRERFRQVVLPIFYKVQKSDVANQTGKFGAPFENVDESFPGLQHRVPAWKEALTTASNIAGYVLPEQRESHHGERVVEARSPSKVVGVVAAVDSSPIQSDGVITLAGIGYIPGSVFCGRVLMVSSVLTPVVVIKGRSWFSFSRHVALPVSKVLCEAMFFKTCKTRDFLCIFSHECDFVDKIAKETFKTLNKLSPCEIRGLPGAELRMQELEKLLNLKKKSCVRVVGVLGMAGIGKTTVADCVYKRSYGQFDGYCFLANIYNEERLHGLDYLQQKLLRKLLDEENLDVGAPDGAHEALKDRLRNKRLFIVLDNVTNEDQIRILIGPWERELYREGSRIVITTRDKKLLEKIVDATYVVPRLSDREALELFCLTAFSNNLSPTSEFLDLSNKFVDYAKGHPLALKLLGSDLCQRDKFYWKKKLERLQKRPDGKIQEVLKISYEELCPEQKSIFLDVACFFRSEKSYFVSKILDTDHIDALTVIDDLVDKCLVTIYDNRLEMHDLLLTMGKEIGYESSIKEAGNRGRLWHQEDICHVLKYKTGTAETRGIFLDMSNVESMKLSSDVFTKMWNLKFLKFYNSHCSQRCENDCKFRFPGGLDCLPDELVYLHWEGYPLEYLPSNFNPKKLVDLNLRHSHLRGLWEDKKNTAELRWVDLSHSKDLLSLSCLLEARNLQRLNAECCTSLVKCSSIHQMDNLVYLNLKECTSLTSLQKGINLKSLKTLILSGCSILRKFPTISENIEYLYLDGTAIRRIPESIESLRRLAMLSLKKCCRLRHLPISLRKLKSLQELILSGCSKLECFPEIDDDMEHLEVLLMDQTAIKQIPRTMFMSNLKIFTFGGSKVQDSTDLELLPFSGCSRLSDLYLTDCNIHKLPNNFSCLMSLHSLCLSRNNLENLPESIRKLHQLRSLDLKHCRKLKSLPVLPSNLQYLDAHDCASLETVAKPMMLLAAAERVQSTFIFTDCFKLNRDAQENIVAHAQLKSQILANACLQRDHKGLVLEPLVSVSYPGSDLPLWFRHQRMGSSMETLLPPHWCDNKFLGFSLCVVVSFKDYEDQTSRFSVICKCKFKNENGECSRFVCNLGGWNETCGSSGHQSRKIGSDHVFLSYNNYFHVKKYREESNDHNRCHNTAASFKFIVTDVTKRKLESCEVVKCGMSLLYAPDENDYRLQETLANNLDEVIPINEAGRHENASGEVVLPKRGRPCLQDEAKENGKRLKEEMILYS